MAGGLPRRQRCSGVDGHCCICNDRARSRQISLLRLIVQLDTENQTIAVLGHRVILRCCACPTWGSAAYSEAVRGVGDQAPTCRAESGPRWVRPTTVKYWHQRSPAVTDGSEEPQVTGPPGRAAGDDADGRFRLWSPRSWVALSGSKWAATGVRNDRGARPQTVEDHDRRFAIDCH
jgi:hypothetical protein